MSEWASRLGLLFPDRTKVEIDPSADDVSNDNLQNLALKKDFDEVKETKPTYEQISQERILDEANKNIQILKSLETILQERTQSYSTFFAAQGKYKPSYEIFQYCEGTLRQALDALFVFLEQELQQARQQQTLGDLRKALSEVKLNAQKRLSDYQRELANSDKEVAAAEKKLAKSKEQLEKSLEQKHRLECGDNENTLMGPRRPLTITRYHTQRVDVNKQEKVRECSESVARSDKDIKDGIQCLLKALTARDQILVASRRAYQKLDKDCKKMVAITFRKLIIREREAAAARETVLAKLESAVDAIDVDADLEDFIMQHRQGDEGSLHCCGQALMVLGDLVPLETQNTSEIADPSSAARSRSESRDEDDSNTPGQSRNRIASSADMKPFSPNSDTNSKFGSSQKWDAHRELQKGAYHASTPIAPVSTASSTLSYAVNTGLPIAEAFATIVSLCTGEVKKVENIVKEGDLSSEKIVEHLNQIFYCHWTPSSVEKALSSPSGVPRQQTLFMNQTLTIPLELDDSSSDSMSAQEDELMGSCSDRRGHSPYKDEGDSVCSERSHPLSLSHQDPLHVKVNMKTKSTSEKSETAADNTMRTPSRSHKSDSSRRGSEKENILGTNIADDFYSSVGSTSAQSSLPHCPSNTINTGDGKNISTANLEYSASFLSEVVKSQKGRDSFIIELNQFRSKKVEMGAGFVILGVVLWDLLDRCKEDNDVHSAKIIMMLSQTFYRRLNQPPHKNKKRRVREVDVDISAKAPLTETEAMPPLQRRSSTPIPPREPRLPPPPSQLDESADEGDIDIEDGALGDGKYLASTSEKASDSDADCDSHSDEVGDDDRLADRGAGNREYLKSTLMAHDIWKDRSFWEQTLWQCTMEQLHTIPCERAWHDLPEEQRLEPVRMVHSVIFSQVMAITHSMIELGCSKSQTRDFLQRMCVLHELSERQRQDLLIHLMSR